MTTVQAQAAKDYRQGSLAPVTFLVSGLGIAENLVSAAGAWALIDPKLAAMSEQEQKRQFHGTAFYVPGIHSPFSLTDALGGPACGRPEPASWWTIPLAADILGRTEEYVQQLSREGALERRGERGAFEVSGASLYRQHRSPVSLVSVSLAARDAYQAPLRPGSEPSPYTVQSSLTGKILDIPPGAPPTPGNTPRKPEQNLGVVQGRVTSFKERTA